MFEKIVEVGILFDFYGKLLNDKQYTAIELYYIHDLSLSEIGEHLGISRQGVHDLLKRSESKLFDYEEKLGLVKKFSENRKKIKLILEYTDEIMKLLDYYDFNLIKEDINKISDIALEILEIGQEVK
ncbi:YlxM family DNA-binding protein [Proteiniborus sp.]|uniref:YlxM family DNA-binding protein n=1 Tax=Proteiniborus sp. TaxID=2079015 RepID=UPI00332DFF58